MAHHHTVENFTVVTAEEQSNGRGQMGATWVSEKGKNLTMSILIQVSGGLSNIFTFHIAIALALITALKNTGVQNLSLKWPNDIMSGNKKIGGILIENIIKANAEITSIVGIGINVNQTNFTGLPKASSLALICGKEFDRESLMETIVNHIKIGVLDLDLRRESLWADYTSYLYKINVPMTFQTIDGKQFMGMIKGVASGGKLEVLLENDQIKTYEVKEIQMLY